MIKGIYPYYIKTEVEERDCFPNLKMTPSAMLILVQEVSGGHIASLGWDYERLYSEGIVFMLSSLGMKIIKNPVMGDKITVATCPAKAFGAHMMRETVILDEEENVLCEIQASWVMLDINSGKILRPSELPAILPVLKEYHPFAEVWKMRFPSDGEKVCEREVRLSDLDRNYHMNNTVYAKVICDLFPDEILKGGVKELYIKYKKQARLGDVLSIHRKEKENIFYINAKSNEESYFQGSIVLDKIN